MAQTNQFGSNLSSITYPFFDLAWNAYKVPEYYEYIIQRYGNQSITGLMDMYGTKTTRADKTFFHMEDNRLHSTLVVDAQTAAGAGLPVTLTIAAGSHVMGGAKSPVQPRFAVQFKDGKMGLVTVKDETTPGAHEITVEPFDTNYTISTSANETLTVIPANFVGAGSCVQPSQIKVPGFKYQNTMETIRTDLTIDGEMLAAWNGKMRVVKGVDKRTGKVTDCWWNELLGDYYQQFMNAREILLITGENITNSTLTGGAYNLTGFNGLINSIIPGGNVQNYSSSIGFKLTDWKLMALRLDRERACNEFYGEMGNEIFMDFQDELKAAFPNGAVSFASFNNNAQAALKWGFSSFEAYGYTLHLRKLPLFTDPSLLGMTGSKFPGNAILIPACKTTDNAGDPTSYIQITHLAGCGYERMFHHGVTGGASWLPETMRTDACDSVTFTYLEQFGFELFKNNHFYYIRKAA